MSIFKKTLICAAVAVAFSGAAHAVSIDPDGAGAMSSTNVDVLDWTVGNALVTKVSGNVQLPAVGDIFQTYAHAQLSSFNANNVPVAGLFGNSEWTYVTGFQEQVVAASGVGLGIGSVTFDTIAGGNNFFQIWYSDTFATKSNGLKGTGFNDGTLVLSGTVNPFDLTDPTKNGETSFTANTTLDANGNLVTSALDQAGANNYSGITTVSGQGGGRIGLTINFVNSAFIGALPGTVTMDFNTQINIPFTLTDPSACFFDGTGTINGVGGQGTLCGNDVGLINGASGPNTVLMTDSATNINGVPEPMSVALMGMGLLAMGFTARRRKA